MFKDETCDLVHIDLARVVRLREALVAPGDVEGLSETFRALGDPTRVRILDVLSHGELCVCDLAAVLRVSQSAVSHQLRLLRSLRLVRSRRDGRMIFYALDDKHIIQLFRQTLKHVQEATPRRGDQPAAMRGDRPSAFARSAPADRRSLGGGRLGLSGDRSRVR